MSSTPGNSRKIYRGPQIRVENWSSVLKYEREILGHGQRSRRERLRPEIGLLGRGLAGRNDSVCTEGDSNSILVAGPTLGSSIEPEYARAKPDRPLATLPLSSVYSIQGSRRSCKTYLAVAPIP